MSSVDLFVGQSVNLMATPLFNGMPGGEFQQPVVWTQNAFINSQQVNLIVSPDTLTAVLQAVYGAGVFTVTAQAGALFDTCNITVHQPANGLRLDVGNVF